LLPPELLQGRRGEPTAPRPEVRPGPAAEVLVWPTRERTSRRERTGEWDRLLDLAVAAHVDWKEHLRERIGSGQVVDLMATLADDQCALGQWIHGEGARQAEDPDFRTLVAWHRRFHSAAGVVVSKAASGRRAEALELLEGASYEWASTKVIAALRQLKRTLGSEGRER
jgi:hypothetical protein